MTDTGEMGPRDAVWLAIWDWLGKQRASPYDLVDAILALPQLAAQQARIVELEGALEPFARFAEAIPHMGGNFPKTGSLYSIHPAATGERELTAEDFRRAAALRKDPQQ